MMMNNDMLSMREAGLQVIDKFVAKGGTFRAADFTEEVSKLLPTHSITGIRTCLSKDIVSSGAAIRISKGYYRPVPKDQRVEVPKKKYHSKKAKEAIKDLESLILHTPLSHEEIGLCHVAYAVKLSTRIEELEKENKALRTELYNRVTMKEETIKHLNHKKRPIPHGSRFNESSHI